MSQILTVRVFDGVCVGVPVLLAVLDACKGRTTAACDDVGRAGGRCERGDTDVGRRPAARRASLTVRVLDGVCVGVPVCDAVLLPVHVFDGVIDAVGVWLGVQDAVWLCDGVCVWLALAVPVWLELGVPVVDAVLLAVVVYVGERDAVPVFVWVMVDVLHRGRRTAGGERASE